MLNGLDIFSGIGGLSSALRLWVKPLAYCECDPYAQAVLMSRMQRGYLPSAPIWDRIETLCASEFERFGTIDIIYGGFPCQDISVAGNGEGLAGKRSGFVSEVFRLVRECAPQFVFLENVPAIRTRGAESVCKELASQGYDCRWDVVSAAEVGAPHLRKRWFLLAHTQRHREWEDASSIPGKQNERDKRRDGPIDCSPNVPNAERLKLRDESRWSGRAQGQSEAIVGNDGPEESLAHAPRSRGAKGKCESKARGRKPHPFERSWWETEPDVGRVVDGVPQRVDRIRGLGNAVVPIQAREAFKRLMGL